MTTDKEWLDQLKLGDSVILSGRTDKLAKVQQITKAHFIVNGLKFSRKTGFAAPAYQRWFISLAKPTGNRLRSLQIEASKTLLYYSLKSLDLTDEQVVEIARFVRKVAGRKTENVE